MTVSIPVIGMERNDTNQEYDVTLDKIGRGNAQESTFT